MRPIPASRLGDAHGLLRAIAERERLRLDELATHFDVTELFPPDLENAIGRTRLFIAYARAAGLLNEDRGTAELTEMGKRYVRAADPSKPFDVAPAQAEWLRRLLRERHMTDTIYHGAAIGLSLFASNPPGFHASTRDFGRALNYLGRCGWDSDNTFLSQGERYATFLQDLELIDEERRLTPTGAQVREDLTLPIHMSLKDLAGQLNPGGPEAAEREGEAEWAAAVAPAAPPEPEPEPEPVFASPAVVEEDEYEYEDVGPGAPAVETPVPAGAAPAAPTADAPLAPPPSPPAPAPAPAPFTPPPPARFEELAASATVASSTALLSASAIAAAAQEAGLRLPVGVFAAVAAALSGGHVVLVGPAGSGKTTLALAIAKAAAQAGRAGGATLATAAHRWSGRDTAGRPGDEEWQRGIVVDAAARGRWLVLDELDRARLDRALGELSSFLGGAPVALPDGEASAPGGWRIVATATEPLRGSPALVRRFAHVHVPPPHDSDLALAIGAAAAGDMTAASAVRRLVGARDLGAVGTGAFLDAARFAAQRNAAAPADEATLAREALAACIAPVLGTLDEERNARLQALAG